MDLFLYVVVFDVNVLGSLGRTAGVRHVYGPLVVQGQRWGAEMDRRWAI